MEIWCLLRVIQKNPLCRLYFRDLLDSLTTLKNFGQDLNVEFILDHWARELPRVAEIVRTLVVELEQEKKVVSSLSPEIQLCHYLSPNYPQHFLKMEGAPITFQFIGEPSWNNRRLLGIVGSREPTELTLKWMRSDAYRFVKEHFNLSIVSGGARGVDQVAHQLALASQKPTLAWLPSGLSQIYPQSLKAFVPQILEGGGALLSEFDDQTQIKKHHFHIRNRLIAGMVDMLLVPQASARSGTLMTAHTMLELGRPLFVLPGHPLLPSYAGNLELLQLGGVLTRDSSDLVHFSEAIF